MTLKKIFWIVLVITLLVWTGVGIYYFRITPILKPPPFTPKITSPPQKESSVSDLKKENYLIGYFANWEEIEGSLDKYLLLTSRATGQLLPKVRVILGRNSLYNESLLLSVKITVKEDQSGETASLYPEMEKITFQEFKELVKPGDTVKVFLKTTGKGDKSTDQNGYFLAAKVWLIEED